MKSGTQIINDISEIIDNYDVFFIDLWIERRQCPTLKKKTQCHIPIVERSAGRSQCHPAAAEGAKLSRMRRGKRFSFADNGVSDLL